jgi:rubredoxin
MKCSNCGFTFNLSFPQRGFIWELKKLNKFNIECPKCQKNSLEDIGDAQFNGIYPVYTYDSISKRAETAITVFIFAAVVVAFIITSIMYTTYLLSYYIFTVMVLLILVPIGIYLLSVKHAKISLES